MLFYFELQGVATFLTRLLTEIYKEVQKAQGITPEVEVAHWHQWRASPPG